MLIMLAFSGCTMANSPESDTPINLPVSENYPSEVLLSEEAGVYVGDFKYTHLVYAIYSLKGDDAHKFYINEEGSIYFKTPPDFEQPKSVSGDNIYHFTVHVFDGNKGRAQHKVTVKVQNIDEGKTAPIPIEVLFGSDGKADNSKSLAELKILKARMPSSVSDGMAAKIAFYNRKNNYKNTGYTLLGETNNISKGLAELTLDSSLKEAQYQIVAQLTLKDGKVSSYSDPLSITVDSTPPPMPTNLTLATADGIVGDDVRKVGKAVISISARTEAWGFIEFYRRDDSGISIMGRVQADGNGLAKLELVNPVSNGKHRFFARAFDNAGLQSIKDSPEREIDIFDSSNTSPVFSPDLPTELHVNEGSSMEIPGLFIASDKDEGDILSYSLDGADKDFFRYSNGKIRFRRYPDFEAKDSAAKSHEYELKIVAKDTNANTAVHTLKVVLDDVDDSVKTLRPLELRLYDNDGKYFEKDKINNGRYPVSAEVYAPGGSTVKLYVTRADKGEKSYFVKTLTPASDNDTLYKSSDIHNTAGELNWVPIPENQESTYTYSAKAAEKAKTESEGSVSWTQTYDRLLPASPVNIIIKAGGRNYTIADGSTLNTTITISEIPSSIGADKKNETDQFIVLLKGPQDQNGSLSNQQSNGKIREVIDLTQIEKHLIPFLAQNKNYEYIKQTGTYELTFKTLDTTENFNADSPAVTLVLK